MPVIKAEPEDVPLSEIGAAPSGGGWGPAREDGEESDDDMAMGGGMDSVIPGASAHEDIKPKLEDDEIGGSSGSTLVSKGMASTLSLLRHQGLIVPRTPEELERDRVQKEREAWLAAQRRRDREREEEKQRSRAAGSSIDQQQREYENRMREQRDAQASMAAYSNYKPNVNLTYHDEFGRDQTPKEVRRLHSFSAALDFALADHYSALSSSSARPPAGLEATLAQLPRQRFGQQEDGEAFGQNCS